MLYKLKLWAFSSILSIIPLVGWFTMNSDFADAQSSSNADSAIVPPTLIPPSFSVTENVDEYTNLPAAAEIPNPDNRPIARLSDIPDFVQNTAALIPKNLPNLKNDVVSYQITSSVRYTGNNRTVLVTTARPSAAAINRQISFGETSKLADGSIVQVRTNVPGNTPNAVVLTRNNLVITIASDLPLEDVKNLARSITFN